MKYGRYNLVTRTNKNKPVISTIFYIDGDVLNNLYEIEGELLAENHEELVRTHMDKVKTNVGAMDILRMQITSIITLFVSAFTFIKTYSEFGLVNGFISTTVIASLILLFRKSLAKIVFWVLRLFLRLYLTGLKRKYLKF